MSTAETVAVIMACHNRRDTSVRCLRALAAQQEAGVSISLFVTDDGSTDGTVQAIQALWPGATILAGDGSLYWAAAMALAERQAVRQRPDYVLWLNDDTELRPGAVRTLLEQAHVHPHAIIVGATVSPTDGRVTYGGRRRIDDHPQRFRSLGLSESAQRADTFNGNVVLIPSDVRSRVGPIDDRFPHAYADDDYGLRAQRLGVPIWQAPGAVAACEANLKGPELSGGWLHRWKELQSPTGLPWRAQVRYLRRHGDWRWPLWLAAGQLRRVVLGQR